MSNTQVHNVRANPEPQTIQAAAGRVIGNIVGGVAADIVVDAVVDRNNFPQTNNTLHVVTGTVFGGILGGLLVPTDIADEPVPDRQTQ